MKLLIMFIAIFMTGCASISENNTNYNTLDNYEIVFVDDKMAKTSKLALKQINNNDLIYKIQIELFRQHENDLKSMMTANIKKKEIESLLDKKELNFKYNPKETNHNAILKAEK